MRLEPIGRVENPQDLDFEPLVVPIVGYDRHTKEEQVCDVQCRPVAPTGAAVDVMRVVGPNGETPIGPVMAYLDSCILPESKEDYETFIHDPELVIEQKTLINMYIALTEFYSERPTPPRSVSHNGRTTTPMTSAAASPLPVEEIPAGSPPSPSVPVST
jgi:hypothetical protein